jgi:hypothetical protein
MQNRLQAGADTVFYERTFSMLLISLIAIFDKCAGANARWCERAKPFCINLLVDNSDLAPRFRLSRRPCCASDGMPRCSVTSGRSPIWIQSVSTESDPCRAEREFKFPD